MIVFLSTGDIPLGYAFKFKELGKLLSMVFDIFSTISSLVS